MADQIRTATLLIVGGNEEERLKKAEEIFGFNLHENINNPDFLWLKPNEEEATLSLGVEAVRHLRQFLALKPFEQNRKNVLIQAEFLTTEAQNALLKTLEEPPRSTILILTCFESSFLLSTVVSRCQIIQLASHSQIRLTSKEQIDLWEAFQQLKQASLNEKFSLLEKWGVYKDRPGAEKWLNGLIYVLRQQMLENPSLYLEFATQIKLIEKARKQLQANCNIRLVMDCFILNFLAF